MAQGFFLSGLAANACVQSTAVVVSSEDLNPDFQKASLQNGLAWHPFRFGTTAANPFIDFDMNMALNGNFQTDAAGVTPPTGWLTKSGSPTITTAQFNEGTQSVELNDTSEALYRDHLVVPGNTYRVSVALRGDGSDGAAAFIIDLNSGKYWTGSAWTTTKTAFATQTAAAWATTAGNVTFEASIAGHIGPTICRLMGEFSGSAPGTGYVDSFYMWPSLSFAALMYHTIPTAFSIAVSTDDNAAFSSPTARGTLPQRRFRTYVTFNTIATPERYARFQITGQPFDGFIPWIGQTFLGERKVMTRSPGIALLHAREIPQQGTNKIPVNTAEATRYELEARWRADLAAGTSRSMEDMVGGCKNGMEPLLVVPRDDEPEFVYGRGAELRRFEKRTVAETVFEYSLSYLDDEYPVVTK